MGGLDFFSFSFLREKLRSRKSEGVVRGINLAQNGRRGETRRRQELFTKQQQKIFPIEASDRSPTEVVSVDYISKGETFRRKENMVLNVAKEAKVVQLLGEELSNYFC